MLLTTIHVLPFTLLPPKLVNSVSGAPSCQRQVRHWIKMTNTK